MRVEEVAQELGISKSHAYKVIHSPTELAQAIQTDMAVNRLTKHLNVNASRLLEEHQVKYENKTKHAGRRIRLTYMVVEASAFEVIR